MGPIFVDSRVKVNTHLSKNLFDYYIKHLSNIYSWLYTIFDHKWGHAKKIPAQYAEISKLASKDRYEIWNIFVARKNVILKTDEGNLVMCWNICKLF